MPSFNLFPYGNLRVVALGKLVVGDRANLVGHYLAADGVLDVGYLALHRHVEVRAVLEHAVARLVDGAVFQRHVVGVAQYLLAAEVAAHELQVLRVPADVLAVDVGVVDRHVVALPERVLGGDVGVVYLHVAAILEDIFRVARQSVHDDAMTVHEGVGAAVQRHVVHLHVVDMPEGLVGIVDGDVLQGEVLHLAEELRTVYHAVAHSHVVAVPDGRARARREIATRDEAAVHVPPGVFAIKLAVVALYVVAALYRRLAVGHGYVLQLYVVGAKQRALAAE